MSCRSTGFVSLSIARMPPLWHFHLTSPVSQQSASYHPTTHLAADATTVTQVPIMTIYSSHDCAARDTAQHASSPQDSRVWIGGSRGPPWRYALLASAPTIYTLKYLSTFGSAHDLYAARLVLRSCTLLVAPVICTARLRLARNDTIPPAPTIATPRTIPAQCIASGRPTNLMTDLVTIFFLSSLLPY